MSDRNIPLEPDAVCDICGAVGAYDIMGDYYCAECLAKLLDHDEAEQVGR